MPEIKPVPKKSLLLLALLSAFPALSTDMYLASLPLLQKQWEQPPSQINLTLVAFFLAYCFFLLVYGPLGDRFGRRPPLLAGIAVYVAASLGCAFSPDLPTLILSRAGQGAGAAAASSLALALCKDLFTGLERERILARLAMIIGLAPMIAPVIGGWLLTRFPWPAIFLLQAAMGGTAWIGVRRMVEPLHQPSSQGIIEQLRVYPRLLANRGFFGLAMMMSLTMFPLFAFIGGAADIYIGSLGLSERTFGCLFGFNALAYIAGSFSCSRLAPRISSRRVITLGCWGGIIGSLFLLASPHHTPWGLALPMFTISLFIGFSRPSSTHLALEQITENAGMASSLLVFTFFLFGALGMWVIAWDWTDKIRFLGFLGLVCGTLSLGMWIRVQRFLNSTK